VSSRLLSRRRPFISFSAENVFLPRGKKATADPIQGKGGRKPEKRLEPYTEKRSTVLRERS